MSDAAANTPPAPATVAVPPVILITGISGSGKSVALAALEDGGYFCVDNLPPELLREFLELQRGERGHRKVAVAVDVRSAGSLPLLLALLRTLRAEGVAIESVFLDASTDTLVRRYSETRRRHPLSSTEGEIPGEEVAERAALQDAIEHERGLLSELREVSTVVDTSDLRPAQLRAWLRELVNVASGQLTLLFESFAFKHGVPRDADFVFDVRVLPNPHYVRELRALTGRDAPVADYLAAQPEVGTMLAQIESFVAHWLPAFAQDQRGYLTVAIGCTGGQHRSVYIVEQLARRFRGRTSTLVRHRELGSREPGTRTGAGQER
jgi:UPF0042 nucleotide-binding protein